MEKQKSLNHLKKMSIEEMMKMDNHWKKKHAKAYYKRLEEVVYELLNVIGKGLEGKK